MQIVFPELVKGDDEGYLSIDYVSLIPVLVEALKEQNDRIAQLENIKNPKEKNAESAKDPLSGVSSLGQNSPNPFNKTTTVEYFLPTGINKAVFYIYNMQGKQIKSYGIVEREHGSITISANELQPGIYLYSILADGKIIGTEQMVITD